MTYSRVWKFVYKFYPPVLRAMEFLRLHSGRQPYRVGFLKDIKQLTEIKFFLRKNGFENAILAWKDTDEILSMRKIDNGIFQYHVRCFKDGEITGHYEYSSEGSPLRHITGSLFESRKKYFRETPPAYAGGFTASPVASLHFKLRLSGIFLALHLYIPPNILLV